MNVPVVPEPESVAPPGEAVTVHDPAGKPLNATLPVAVEHVVCVIVPITGVAGTAGAGVTIAEADATEVQPDNVTVNVYVFAAKPVKFAVVPVPVMVAPPGEAVTVHVPGVGNPLNATLPVETEQVG